MTRAILIALAACGASTTGAPRASSSDPAPPSNATDLAHAHAALARADHALAESMPIDYERPLDGKPLDRRDIAKLFLEACRGGEAAGCWMAMQLDDESNAAKLVETNCMAGDTLSCRALPEFGFNNTPGAVGRHIECHLGGSGCDLSALRTECQLGFPWSCWASAEKATSPADREALRARAREISRSGCGARIVGECELVRYAGSEADQIESSRIRCELDGTCYNLAHFAERTGDRVRRRDLLERACQYGKDWLACSDLAIAYLDRRLEEPVTGRGMALARFACEKIRAIRRHDDKIEACLAAARP